MNNYSLDGTGERIDGIHFVESPNCDDRPDGTDIDTLVLHGISLPPGDYGGDGVERLFTNSLDPAAHPYYAEIAGLEVSAHLFVRRDGDVQQFVPFGRRAWHAGMSSLHGRTRCNDFSIGIELEGSDDEAYDDRQYETLCGLVRLLMATYPRLSARNIVAHSDISPGRKTDPGPAFDWLRLYDGVRKPGTTDTSCT